MFGGKPNAIFDISGLNALTDDADGNAIVTSLSIGFGVRLTETNIAEIGANRRATRRDQLLGTCRRLVPAGECIKPYHEIIEDLTRQYQHNPVTFDWRRVNLRSHELEYEVERQEILDDQMALEIKADFDARSKGFASICDQFITNDTGQYNSLNVVATEANLPTRVRTYEDFRQGLLIQV